MQPDPCVLGLLTWSPPNDLDLGSLAKHIARLFEMPAGDDHRPRAHFQQLLPGRFHSLQILHFHAGQKFRFGHVGRDHAGALEKFVAHEFQARGIEQLGVAGRGTRNRIEHHVHEFVRVEKIGDRGRIRAVGQHSDFHGRDRRRLPPALRVGRAASQRESRARRARLAWIAP